jgi:hypothetical protein
MTMLLVFLGILLMIVGGLMLLVAMFRASIWWGIFGLIFAPVQIVFVFKYWDESRSAIFAQIAGMLMILASLLLGGDTFTEEFKTQFNQRMQSAAPGQMQQLKELQSMVTEPDATTDSSAATDEGAVEAPASTGNQKVIHKCIDAKGRVAYTEQPCAGTQEKVITIKSIEEPPENSTGNVLDTVKKIVAPDTQPTR